MKKFYILIILIFVFPVISKADISLVSNATTTPPLTNSKIEITGYQNNGNFYVLVNPNALTWTNSWDHNCGYNYGTTLQANGGFYQFDADGTGCSDKIEEEGTWYIQCFNGGSACSSLIAIGVAEEETPPETATSTATSTASLGDISFGLAIIITLLSLGLVGLVFNTINKKEWQK